MKQPIILSDNVYFDEDSETIILRLEETISMNLHIQEFWELSEEIAAVRKYISDLPGYVVVNCEDGQTQIVSIDTDEVEH